MTDSRDRISGPTPADRDDDDASRPFFDDTPPADDDSIGDHAGADVGYTGGLAAGTGSAAGMRGIVRDDQAADANAREQDGNLAQQDQ